jgi:hypothetical protein
MRRENEEELEDMEICQDDAVEDEDFLEILQETDMSGSLPPASAELIPPKLRKEYNSRLAIMNTRKQALARLKIGGGWIAMPSSFDGQNTTFRYKVCSLLLTLGSAQNAKDHYNSARHQENARREIANGSYVPTLQSYDGLLINKLRDSKTKGFLGGGSESLSLCADFNFSVGSSSADRRVELQLSNGEVGKEYPELMRLMALACRVGLSYNALSTLLKSDFVTMASSLQLRYALPKSAKTLSKKVEPTAAFIRAEVKHYIEEHMLVNSEYVIIFDESSSYKYGIINVVAMFSEGRDFLVDSRFLDVKGTSSENLAEFVLMSLKNIGLSIDRCAAIGCDNGRNAIGAAQVIRSRFPHITIFSCLAHSLQLCIRTFLDEKTTDFENPFPHVRATLLAVRKFFTKGARGDVRDLEAAVPGASCLCFASTRWNSMRDAIAFFVENRLALADFYKNVRLDASTTRTQKWKDRIEMILRALFSLVFMIEARVLLYLTDENGTGDRACAVEQRFRGTQLA